VTQYSSLLFLATGLGLEYIFKDSDSDSNPEDSKSDLVDSTTSLILNLTLLGVNVCYDDPYSDFGDI